MNIKDFESKSANTFERKWAKEFNEFIKSAESRKKELDKELKDIDYKRQECLHFLELEGQNAAVRARVTKILTESSKNRRLIKEEMSDIQSVIDKIHNPKKILNENANRSYSYSEDFLTEVFGKETE